MKKKIYLFIPVMIFITSYLVITGQHKTIIPVDLYSISPQLYEPGNGLKIHNHFVMDYAELYLPWKFYLTQFHPEECITEIHGPLMSAKSVGGVKFPGGECYPLSAVRPYTQVDSIFLLSKIFSFFTAYNLSYLCSDLFFYLCSCFFLWCVLFESRTLTVEDSFYIGLLSTLMTTCFPVARDLQSDGLSQSLPYVLVALGFLKISFSKRKIFFLLSGIFLFLGIYRSSLQALGFCPLFFILFAGLWILPKEKRNKNLLILSLVTLSLATVAGVVYNFSSIALFLLGAQKFIPVTQVPLPLLLGRKLLVEGFSLGQFFLGDFISSFSTVDFSKAIGSLGARDYLSYDWVTFFINPFVSFFFALVLMISIGRKRVVKLFAPVFIIDLIIIFLPTYKFLYFRFHQWWLVTNIIYIMGILLRENVVSDVSFKKIFRTFLYFLGIIFCLFVFTDLFKTHILTTLDHKGVLGFEPLYWSVHLENLLLRLSFRDFYSLTFTLSAMVTLFSFRKNLRALTLVIVTLSGLLLNTFYINYPQAVTPFYTYQKALKENRPLKEWGYGFTDNVKLLVNERPCSFYESLKTEPLSCP